MERRKERTRGQEGQHLHRATWNGVWLRAVYHQFNGTEFFWEEFQDNVHLRYSLMPQDISTTCDGSGKKLLIDHSLPCPKGGLILVRHDDT